MGSKMKKAVGLKQEMCKHDVHVATDGFDSELNPSLPAFIGTCVFFSTHLHFI